MTRQISVGGVKIGGGAPVVIQSMLNTKTTDVEGSLAQIKALQTAGCQIARLAVPNMEAAKSFAQICSTSTLPISRYMPFFLAAEKLMLFICSSSFAACACTPVI